MSDKCEHEWGPGGREEGIDFVKCTRCHERRHLEDVMYPSDATTESNVEPAPCPRCADLEKDLESMNVAISTQADVTCNYDTALHNAIAERDKLIAQAQAARDLISLARHDGPLATDVLLNDLSDALDSPNYYDELEKVSAERDRYRAALQRIQLKGGWHSFANTDGELTTINQAQEIASEALRPDEGE